MRRLLLATRLLQLVVGLVLYGVADALMIRAEVGVDPWTVFAQGLAGVTGMGIGFTETFAVSETGCEALTARDRTLVVAPA